MTLFFMLNPKHFTMKGGAGDEDVKLLVKLLRNRKNKKKKLKFPTEEQEKKAKKILKEIDKESPYSIELVKQKLEYNLLQDTLDGIVESLEKYTELERNIEEIQKQIEVHQLLRERRLMILRQMELTRVVEEMKAEEDLLIFLLLSEDEDGENY